MNSLQKFFAELKRRKVFHVGSLYLITGWGASLGAAELFPAFGIPDWVVRAFVITVALGFPLALVLAWAFEITPEGVVFDPGTEEKPPAGMRKLIPDHAAETTVVQTAGVAANWYNEGAERRKEFHKDFTLGRGREADVQVVNNRISRLHAKVKYERGAWWIMDLSSRNGTILNGQLLEEPGRLLPTNEVVLYEGAAPIELLVQEEDDETVFD